MYAYCHVYVLLLCMLFCVYSIFIQTTLTEVFPCFSLSCTANARVYLAKTGHGPHSSCLVIVLFYVLFCIVLFYVLFWIVLFYILFWIVLFCVLFWIVLFYVLSLCKCVLYYCHRVSTQLQLNIYLFISYIYKFSYCYLQD